MKLYVIRHGLTKSNKLKVLNGQAIDEPLEAEGVEQVRGAISTLPKNIEKIYSSNMLRTKQTAEILNEALNLEVTFHPELREIEFGNLSGSLGQKLRINMVKNCGIPMLINYMTLLHMVESLLKWQKKECKRF